MTNDHVENDDGPIRDCQHTQVTHRHGTRQAYVLDRCRCPPCTRANTLAARERTTAIAYGTWSGLVDAGPSRAHVQKLRTAGLSLKQVAFLSHVARQTLNALIYGDPSRQRPPTARVQARTEEQLLAVRFTVTALPETDRILATGSRRRLHALAVLGWPIPALAAHTSLTERTLLTALTAKSLSVATATQIAGLYDRLRCTRPPAGDHDQRDVVQAEARQARAVGWRPPQAWDDIDTDPDPDDPNLEPDLGTQPNPAVMDEIAIERAMTGELVALTAAESQEAVARLTSAGTSAQRISELLRLSHRVVARLRVSTAINAA